MKGRQSYEQTVETLAYHPHCRGGARSGARWLHGQKLQRLVTLKQEVTQKESDIQTTLQRRADLIPNLVNTVKGYASHEESIMKEVSDARAALVGANNTGDQLAANEQMTSALNRLLAIAENYPDLKANTNFIQLQDELSGTENRITQARRAYNDAVKTYNTKIQRFPTSLIAGIFNFEAFDYFQANEGAQEVPSVNFD